MTFATPHEIRAAAKALKTDGYFFFGTRYDPAACETMVDVIDRHEPDADSETKYSGTELRIWSAERKHDLLRAFFDACNGVIAGIEERDPDAITLLAIRNRTLRPGDRDSTIGRWHLDSMRRQLKIFLFLNGASERSGPLELLTGTHRPAFKYRSLLTGALGMPWDFAPGRPRRYARLNDEWVARLSATHPALPVVCEPGTVLIVDTSAIHRARPCVEGSRYALTAYDP